MLVQCSSACQGVARCRSGGGAEGEIECGLQVGGQGGRLQLPCGDVLEVHTAVYRNGGLDDADGLRLGGLRDVDRFE